MDHRQFDSDTGILDTSAGLLFVVMVNVVNRVELELRNV